MRTSRITSHRPLLVVASTLLVMLTGCRDDSPVPTGPAPSGAVGPQMTIGSVLSTTDPLSSRLSLTPGACLVAVRSPNGGYLSRSAKVQLPSKVASSSARIARFAYRGWAPGVPEPVLLAMCTIPDAPSARAYFEKRFGGKPMSAAELRLFAQSAGVAGVEYWMAGTSPYVRQGLEPTYVTDGLASESNATRAAPVDGVTPNLLEPCDPTAIIPEPGCDGYVPEEDYVPATPPPPPAGVNFLIIPRPPALPLPSYVVCMGGTDYPHRSTTRNFEGRISVHSWTDCPIPLPMYVSTALFRHGCVFGRLCGYFRIQESGTISSAGAKTLTAHANTACSVQTGWYVGVGQHGVTMYGTLLTATTVTEPRRLDCW